MRSHPALSEQPLGRPGCPSAGSLLRLVQIGCRCSVFTVGGKPTPRPWPAFQLASTPIWLPQVDWGVRGPALWSRNFPSLLFGQPLYGLIGVQEWLGRGLSVLCSALTIWLVMRLGRRWFNPEAGWWAGRLCYLTFGVYFKGLSGRSPVVALCRRGPGEPQPLA